MRVYQELENFDPLRVRNPVNRPQTDTHLWCFTESAGLQFTNVRSINYRAKSYKSVGVCARLLFLCTFMGLAV